ASPEFSMASDFLTSPMDDSPWEDFLTTPAIESGDLSQEFLTSPAIVDSDNFGDFGDVPLFQDSFTHLSGTAAFDPIKASAPSASGPGHVLPPVLDVSAMYTMPSPHTPSLDPSSLQTSPRVDAPLPPPMTPSTGHIRRKSAPTGTRKNITPESLVPYEAPIQPRKYTTPSATSRKEVPAVFARKRARSQALGEDETPEPSPQELDAIEAKRRQNTLAARRSRKRKLEYQRELEEGIERERAEKLAWQHRAMTLEALLKSHGHEVP
ncbi:hypothetical protein K474DRAFT_1584155, partial [Panus rudis PR-1116 ss-1]